MWKFCSPRSAWRRARALDIAFLAMAAASCSETTVTQDDVAEVVSLIISPASVELATATEQQFTVVGQETDGGEVAVDVNWSATGGEISADGLYQAGAEAGSYRVVATMAELADTAPVIITLATPADGTVLFSENFDSSDFTIRGWYDISTDLPTTTEENRPGGGTRSLQWHWPQGSAAPSPSGSARRLFTPTDRVYLRYWVKFSTNWIGSGVSYHPHEFHLLTTEDPEYVGPASTHLTAYVEHNWHEAGGFPVVSMQDAMNIDQSSINADLTEITENRAVHGCNGFGDTYGAPNACYSTGSGYRNGRSFGSVQNPLWTEIPGSSGYKSSWHQVEAYFQLNTIENGIGTADGVIRYWFDGQLVLDLPGVLMRTGSNPEMRFNQLFLGPHIGVGSPVAQTTWIDDLVLATGRVP